MNASSNSRFRPSPPAPRRASALRALRVAAGALALALGCTLTADEFEPQRVEQAAAPALGQAPAAAPSSPAPEAPDAGEGCTGEGCCGAAQPCAPGERCVDGACQQVTDCAEDPSQCELPRCTGGDCPDQVGGAEASCTDGLRNGDEGDVDCGGNCALRCGERSTCNGDGDCLQPLFCSPENGRCTVASCGDGRLNGGEIRVDCGGECPGCPDGAPCSVPGDCASQFCNAGACQAPTCDDGFRNQDEPGVDCGGSCPSACATGSACAEPADCESGVCAARGCGAGVERCCQAPTCSDGVANGGEPIPDCGNQACGLCADGSTCGAPEQCAGGLCIRSRCESPALCSDGVQSGSETDVDCGGANPSCPRCPDRLRCVAPSDCSNNNCLDGVCISCGDGVTNGTETDVDCGGSDPACQRCADQRSCTQASDCGNNNCFNGRCISCGSGIQDGTETDVDCGGADPACRRCNFGERCLLNTDCITGFCNAGRC